MSFIGLINQGTLFDTNQIPITSVCRGLDCSDRRRNGEENIAGSGQKRTLSLHNRHIVVAEHKKTILFELSIQLHTYSASSYEILGPMK